MLIADGSARKKRKSKAPLQQPSASERESFEDEKHTTNTNQVKALSRTKAVSPKPLLSTTPTSKEPAEKGKATMQSVEMSLTRSSVKPTREGKGATPRTNDRDVTDPFVSYTPSTCMAPNPTTVTC